MRTKNNYCATILILFILCSVHGKSVKKDKNGSTSNVREKRGYKFGDFLLKPAIRMIFGGEKEEETTPYPYANYAFSPGYYSDSLVTCPNSALSSADVSSMKITCKRGGMEISCYENLFQHDTAHVECKEGYIYPRHSRISSDIECLISGRWSHPIYECVADCGRVTKKASALIVHGESTEASEFPWNVAIYRENILICGGTIISERVILSAGHCFTRETSRGIEHISTDEFEIFVGKYFRDINAMESLETQRFKPSKIKIHDTFFGFAGNYDADIAIVTLNKPIVFKPSVAPACLDLDLKTIAEKQAPSHGEVGVVAGYGYTEIDGKPSDRLKKIELPVVDVKTCKQEAPDTFKPFVTSDKFCAGYNDGRGAVCRGDSGAGLVFPKQFDDENIFFIHGIVSNSRSVHGGCDLNFYAMFTHVQNYIDQIKEELRISKLH